MQSRIEPGYEAKARTCNYVYSTRDALIGVTAGPYRTQIFLSDVHLLNLGSRFSKSMLDVLRVRKRRMNRLN